MGEALAIASVGASVLGAGFSIAGAYSAAGAAKSEAEQYRADAAAMAQQIPRTLEQYKAEAELRATAASQEEAERRRRLAATLATQEAIRAGLGVDLMSATGTTIADATQEAAERDIENIRLNRLNAQAQAARDFQTETDNMRRQIARLQGGANMARFRGQQSILAGYAGAFGSLAAGLGAGRTLLSGADSGGQFSFSKLFSRSPSNLMKN